MKLSHGDMAVLVSVPLIKVISRLVSLLLSLLLLLLEGLDILKLRLPHHFLLQLEPLLLEPLFGFTHHPRLLHDLDPGLLSLLGGPAQLVTWVRTAGRGSRGRPGVSCVLCCHCF